MSSTLSWHTCFTQDGGRAQPQGYQPYRGLLPPNFGGVLFCTPLFLNFGPGGLALKRDERAPLLLVSCGLERVLLNAVAFIPSSFSRVRTSQVSIQTVLSDT